MAFLSDLVGPSRGQSFAAPPDKNFFFQDFFSETKKKRNGSAPQIRENHRNLRTTSKENV
jgi:hypothetical protein